ncbi:hypothetical protein B0H17DRAFT_1194478 [Mycena rosella]|uniref:Uncharacterized protein n=1 Tax=Mycena rosella TaxID=1033263 RepID=A0AAD7GNT9_MYCRO|nr:hypothetical protein B0H17DRAFT_1194478 [Mycena rosella]
MSFPKSARFEPQQISDVPGPNSYNLCQESQLDAYKRGAFLEKADRFSKDLPDEVPGPGAYNIAPTANSKFTSRPPPPNLGDRYALLQKKVEDLERIHNDGKKAHQAELDRIKAELSRTQKTNMEHADRLEKQKKQNALLDVRIQDLKKVSSTEQAELKDLRVKLRMSEHERGQLSFKQGEAGELKKAIQALESKRREDIREKDRAIADLEKSAAGERKKRELAETRLQELQGRGDAELAKAQSFRQQLAQAQEETRHAVESAAAAETEAAEKQQWVLDQLEQHRALLARVAEDYARLAAESVSAAIHSKLKHEHGVLQIRIWRLERKLANSEGQITELVNLIRHAHNTNAVFAREIQDLQEECDFYRWTPAARLEDAPQLAPLYADLAAAMRDLHETKSSIQLSDNLLATSLAELYMSQLEQERQTSHDARVRGENLETEVAKTRQERDDHYNQLTAATTMVDEVRTSVARAEQQRSELEHKMNAVTRQSDMASTNHKKAVQQLTETVQRNRMTEDGLRSEIELLTTELADAEQFQAAYYSLSDEVKSLIARNELAEGEAQQLSKFNAEILGHQNPAQRIMYVDRIRRELAEIKHRLAITEAECESVAAHNVELLRELEMYKSASVPMQNKPRTIVTRISRPPLASLNHSTATAPAIKRETPEVDQREDFSYAI